MSEWGPWIEHDGNSEPQRGSVVHRVYADGSELIGTQTGGVVEWDDLTFQGDPNYDGPLYDDSWFWRREGRMMPVLRYRIRKPRGLTLLESLLEDLPELEDA